MEKKPHKHAELIKQWADGESIQLLRCDGSWGDTINPDWDESIRYRVKVEPVIDVIFFVYREGQYWKAGSHIDVGENTAIPFSGEDLKITYHDGKAVKSQLAD